MRGLVVEIADAALTDTPIPMRWPLNAREEPECGASELLGGVGCDGGVLGRLDAADADPGENEGGQHFEPAGHVVGEHQVGEEERADAEGEDLLGPVGVRSTARREARNGSGGVVDDVEPKGDCRGVVVVAVATSPGPATPVSPWCSTATGTSTKATTPTCWPVSIRSLP